MSVVIVYCEVQQYRGNLLPLAAKRIFYRQHVNATLGRTWYSGPFTQVCVYNRAHSFVGELYWGGLWAQEPAIHRAGSKRNPACMDCKSPSKQRICSSFDHQATEGTWYPWTDSGRTLEHLLKQLKEAAIRSGWNRNPCWAIGTWFWFCFQFHNND